MARLIIADLEPLLTSAETAQLLRLKPATLHQNHYRKRGVQPRKVGGRLLYRRDEVLKAAGLLEDTVH